MPSEDTQFKPGESGNPAGRPVEWTAEKLVKFGNDLIDWMNKSQTNIFFQEFCVEKGVYRSVINKHQSKCPEFKELIDMAREIQEMKIVKWSIANKLNTTMSIFLLKNKHGYSDRVEQKVEHTGDMEHRHHHHKLFDDD
jgi:hypothetical protein